MGCDQLPTSIPTPKKDSTRCLEVGNRELGVVTRSAMRDWRSSWSKRAQAAAIAGVGYPLVNALGHTLRWRVEGLHHYDAIVASGRQPVMGFWHGRILSATYYFRRRG